MKSKLDPEGLGIVLLGPFLLEFFPDQVLGHGSSCSFCSLMCWFSQAVGGGLDCTLAVCCSMNCQL